MTKSVSQPALMEPASSGISGKEGGWYCKVLTVLEVSVLGHCVLFGTPYGEKEGEKSLRELKWGKMGKNNQSGKVELPTLETFQSSLDKHWSRVVLLYQIQFRFLTSYCRSLLVLHCDGDKDFFLCST